MLTEIDVKNTLAKIGVDFRRYRILEAGNPTLAHGVLLVTMNACDDAGIPEMSLRAW